MTFAPNGDIQTQEKFENVTVSVYGSLDLRIDEDVLCSTRVPHRGSEFQGEVAHIPSTFS